jgi:hypothetical protein
MDLSSLFIFFISFHHITTFIILLWVGLRSVWNWIGSFRLFNVVFVAFILNKR